MACDVKKHLRPFPEPDASLTKLMNDIDRIFSQALDVWLKMNDDMLRFSDLYDGLYGFIQAAEAGDFKAFPWINQRTETEGLADVKSV